MGTCAALPASVPASASQSVPGSHNVNGVSCTWHKAKVLVPSVTSTVLVSLLLLEFMPRKPEREARMFASIRLETNSLKMVFGARARFSRISWVNWLELVASDLKPSASLAFSVCWAWTSCCIRAARSAAARFSTSANWSWLASCCFSAWASRLLLANLVQLLPQRGGEFRLPLCLGLGRRELLLRLRGIVLQLAVQVFDVGLGGGELLLQLLVFLFARVQLRLLLVRRVAGRRELLLQLYVPLAFLFERQFHHRREVLAGVRHVIGRHRHVGRRRRVFVGHPVDVRRKRQQTQQQEIADDDENAAVHDGKTGVGA